MHAPNLSLSEVSTEKLERELERGRDLQRERERVRERKLRHLLHTSKDLLLAGRHHIHLRSGSFLAQQPCMLLSYHVCIQALLPLVLCHLKFSHLKFSKSKYSICSIRCQVTHRSSYGWLRWREQHRWWWQRLTHTRCKILHVLEYLVHPQPILQDHVNSTTSQALVKFFFLNSEITSS